MADEHQPIIVKKKKHGSHDAHGGAWKVAFADFMTAMMAFFLVMWLVGQSDEVKQAVAGYFRDPGKFMQQGRSGVLKGSDKAIKADGETMGVLATPKKPEFLPTTEEKKRLTLTAKNIVEQLKNQKAFSRLKKNIKIQMTSEGLRIILNESENSPAFFEPGSAKLLQKSAIILVTIAKELGKLSNHLVIEGHTDRSPSGDKQYSNWELSTDRANAARKLMEVSGIRDNQIREVRGYADKFPMIVDNPKDPRNRRVTILVLYESRERQYDEVEIGADLVSNM